MKALLMVSIWLGLAASVMAASKLQLVEGQDAPDFSAPSTAGDKVALADFKGKWLVLTFYPKAFTSGCTKQMCSFRDGFKDIKKLGGVVLGVSRDDLETQKKFKEENNLPFDLLADTEKTVARAYDVLGIFGLYQRRTVIINPQGKVAYVFYAVNVNAHAEEVADVLKKLKEKGGS
jgi:peroxiredoxin Q/BCP